MISFVANIPKLFLTHLVQSKYQRSLLTNTTNMLTRNITDVRWDSKALFTRNKELNKTLWLFVIR